MKVVLDTSVLINFLAVWQLALLAQYTPHQYILTGHVTGEVRQPAQRSVLMQSLADYQFDMESVAIDSPAGTLFEKLICEKRLGAGECAANALASTIGYPLAIDDRAARKLVSRKDSQLQMLGTEDLVALLIADGMLDIERADAMNQHWETRQRFKLPFGKFAELMHTLRSESAHDV